MILYLCAYIDRANIGKLYGATPYSALQSLTSSIGNAKIEGLLEDLNMTGTDYNVALSIFFIPYVLCGKHEP
jgi:hypothetical protein